ncbi:DUF732 domain-containing protein [Mycolicibacillus parakoreensis]|uniref:DUF732 domain-containing protein n=1 Tax=Mycolicibacillus parakoreensis TaxID=1069221 RepID=A0ABY3U2W3_9MYCO|nr:DUF732 domain-containing protein [Mycolicibacillus parakoreensis]MCV7314654.1 DUF732 domain-containing protein [Mycolicibacillus parakoreensis]ULN53031.1 DUF732 domain-containing protein [Mycolicibacillus parakoreensis]
MTRALIALIAAATTGLAVPAPAHADVDTAFADELHTYGIYGQKDYHAWIAKLTCKRLRSGLDAGAQDSATFVSDQLPNGSTTEQAWQFLGGAVNHYCPDQRVVLESAARASEKD